MILPVIICLYYLLESVFVVAYLDTVYFGVTQWQETLYRLDLTTNIYIISSFIFYHCQVVELLLRHGAHIDMKNIQGIRPSQLLAANPVSTVSITR